MSYHTYTHTHTHFESNNNFSRVQVKTNLTKRWTSLHSSGSLGYLFTFCACWCCCCMVFCSSFFTPLSINKYLHCILFTYYAQCVLHLICIIGHLICLSPSAFVSFSDLFFLSSFSSLHSKLCVASFHNPQRIPRMNTISEFLNNKKSKSTAATSTFLFSFV